MQKWLYHFMNAVVLAAVFLIGSPSRWQNPLEIRDPQLTLDQGIIKPTFDRDAAGGILAIGAKP